ncbi:hypothetical protein JTE90_003396 [Oedothorax gibbosus]|uniref:Uncharacterized protein n=1 Tax=Oedothorax gibbosus TaxID=931172 RepID=A0AAV6TZL2_9ARAC|nr:hypothetical protein JTE90_003396 [Oedothorax gibbosus]
MSSNLFKDTCTFSYSDVVLNQDKMNNPIALPKVSRQKNNFFRVDVNHLREFLKGIQSSTFARCSTRHRMFGRHDLLVLDGIDAQQPALNTLSFTYGDTLQNSNLPSPSFVHGPFVDVIQVPVHRMASFLMGNFYRNYLKDEYHRDGIACIDTATFHYLQDLLPKVRYVGPEPLSGHPELLAPGGQDPVFQGRVAAEFIKVAKWRESYPYAYMEKYIKEGFASCIVICIMEEFPRLLTSPTRYMIAHPISPIPSPPYQKIGSGMSPLNYEPVLPDFAT